MGLRTVVLKLHKPGKAKEKVIDEALLNYNMAFRMLLNKAYSNIQEFNDKFKRNGNKYNVMALSKWVDSDMSQELNRYGVQPFKDSLKLEFGTQVANYLRLMHTRPVDDSYGKQSVLGAEDFGKLRPVYFCRYDTKRSYCLLYDKLKDRYYAKLYLLNRENAREVIERSGCGEKLVHIHKDRNVLLRNRRKETYIVVPLSFGKWHENILKKASLAPESFRTARLFKKNGEYFLAVCIETGETESIKTEAFMGISRGLKNKMNYTVVNRDGEILASGAVNSSSENGNTRRINLNELHGAANFVSEIAVLYKAQVLVQNLTEKGDKLSWIEDQDEQYYPYYRRKDYNNFTRLLDYKLEWKCLPKPVKVSSVDIFYTCPGCGMNSKRNRLNKDLFICISCGITMDIENNGSLNLARKLINYHSSKIKITITKASDGVIFTNKILGLDVFASYGENQLEHLKDSIRKIIDSTKFEKKAPDDRTYTSRISLVKKLKSAENFMDLIEYI
ncbi:MAG TPA: zinc ribbon domain-containing protein [Clostridia bacterium]